MRKIVKYALIALSLALATSMFVYFTYRPKKVAGNTQKNIDTQPYLFSLNSQQDFLAMQGEPLSDKFSDVHTVKIIYDLRAMKLYYINSTRFRYHYDFCYEMLGCNYDINSFNSINYGSRRRDYLLGNLNYYRQSNTYTLEFSSEDRIEPSQLHMLYTKICKTTFLKERLKIFLSSDYLNTRYSGGEISDPVITPSEIYGSQSYQALLKGNAYGYLRIVSDLEKQYSQLRPDDIIIIKGTPVNVPVCAGIITNSLQTPLSHINVLCHNRAIPSAADTRIFDKKWLAAYEAKPVILTISDDSISIVETTPGVVAEIHKRNPSAQPVKLKYDIITSGLIPAASLHAHDNSSVGNKAVGIGILHRIAKKGKTEFHVPEGAFAIPFFYYYHHIGRLEIQNEINALLAAKGLDAAATRKQLKRIRKLIKEAPLDAQLVKLVSERIIANKAGVSYRFRSSSNAEDAKGFSGAGLYESKTGILNDTAKSIGKAIKEVWASAWNEQAYHEREYFRIDQRTMMMGIICHRNFPDEAANGVAVTRNLYRSTFPGYTINVQKGEVSVVSPPEGVICEQFISMDADAINPLDNAINAEYITFSSLNNGKPVLDMKQVSLLHRQLQIIHHFMYYQAGNKGLPEYDDYALDIEFKFENNGKLYIKQVRPYN